MHCVLVIESVMCFLPLMLSVAFFMFDVGSFRTLMSSESLYIIHVCETALLAFVASVT